MLPPDGDKPLRPQVRRGYPLSLSISISGGKETYKDSPSNGERTGNSPALESGAMELIREFYQVKPMIRGLGGAMPSTYSQTLNR